MTKKIIGIILGLNFIILSLPLVLKIVPPNSFLGVRTPKTFNSIETWYTVNFYAGIAFLILGLSIFSLYTVKKAEKITNKFFLISLNVPILIIISLVLLSAI